MPVTGARWWGRGCCLTAAHLLLWAVLVLEVVAQQKSDHYKMLGVKKEATDRDIKKAYHKLAIKHHPDKSPECRKSQESSQCKRANRVFMKIAKAYETLSDPEKRRYYDQTGFDDPSHAQQHENQQRRGGGNHHGGGNPFGGGGGPFGGGGGPRPPQPKGPLDEVNPGNFKSWLQNAVDQKKPVLLLFAPAGHSLIEQLGKIRKNDDVKIAKFGHVTASDANNPIMKKYKIKNVPAILLGPQGDPADLTRFEGRMDAEAIERALAIAVRNKLTKEAKEKGREQKEQKARDLVSEATDMSKLQTCLSHHGICMLFFFSAKQARQGVAHLEKLAEQAHKAQRLAKNKKLKVVFMWTDVAKFSALITELANLVRDHQGSCKAEAQEGSPAPQVDEVCRRPPKLPTVLAVLGKKGKFSAYFHTIGKFQRDRQEPQGTKEVLDFLTRVSQGDETTYKLPAALVQAAPAA